MVIFYLADLGVVDTESTWLSWSK